MALWWIGDAIFFFVVIPVVVVLLQRLVKSTFAVGKHINTIHDQAGGIVVAVNDVQRLVSTRDAVKRVGVGLTRYVQAVDRVL